MAAPAMTGCPATAATTPSPAARVQLDPGSVYTVSQVGTDTVIALTGGAQMVLVGVQASSLNGAWIFGA